MVDLDTIPTQEILEEGEHCEEGEPTWATIREWQAQWKRTRDLITRHNLSLARRQNDLPRV